MKPATNQINDTMPTKRRAPTKTATPKKATKAPIKAAAKSVVESTKRKPATKKSAAVKTLAKRPRPVTLVTGGTGFLGQHLVRLLVAEGVENVRVFSTSAPSWLSESGVESIQGSITSPQDVARAVEGVAEIYHLAGRVSLNKEDAHEMFALHVEGTRVLCQAAATAGVKSIVMASTSGTVAVTETGDVVPDEDWPTPLEIISRWPYYASKLYQETVAREKFAGDGRRLVIVNPSLLLGPGDERLSSTKVVLDFLARKIMSVPKGGLSFVDVRDAARALLAAMERGADGERYLLGAANWTFNDFFGRLERITKVAAPRLTLPSKLAVNGAKGLNALFRHWKLTPPVEPVEVEMADYFWYLDASKAVRDLAFAPRDPSETLFETVTYVRENFLDNAAFSRAV